MFLNKKNIIIFNFSGFKRRPTQINFRKKAAEFHSSFFVIMTNI